jgi:hypothetical protein
MEFGVHAFNAACRESVLRYTSEWRDYVTRQARWVDFDNDYKTLDRDYMESVMWALKTLWDKGLMYEGYRVLAYCWRCETPLSNTETRMDDTYRDRQDPAVTVWFELETGERVLAWTTTPWTLPSNLALAVGPDIDYAVMEENGQRYVLAESRLGAYERELADAVRVGTLKGSELVGRRYAPLFDYLTDTDTYGTEAAFRVLAADFVSTEDGTGVVHMAPGFGEDDQNAWLTTMKVSRRSAFLSFTKAPETGCPAEFLTTPSTTLVWCAAALVALRETNTATAIRPAAFRPMSLNMTPPPVGRSKTIWEHPTITALKNKLLNGECTLALSAAPVALGLPKSKGMRELAPHPL